MKCKVCDSDKVIYSGIDAFCLGVVTEKVCYSCANIYAKVKEIMQAEVERAVK